MKLPQILCFVILGDLDTFIFRLVAGFYLAIIFMVLLSYVDTRSSIKNDSFSFLSCSISA